MAFPTTSLLDNFNRSNGNIGGNWTSPEYVGDLTPQISSNTLSAANSSYHDAYLNNISPGPDVEVYMTITTRGATNDELYVDARCQSPGTASLSSYQLYLVFGASDVTWQILKVTNGGSNVSILTSGTQQVVSGDSVGMEITGGSTTTIRALRKPSGGSWSQVLTVNDTTSPITSSGRLGVGLSGSTIRIDDYSGGTVSSGSQTITVGLSSETDTQQSIVRSKSRILGLIEITNSALSLTESKTKNVGLSEEIQTINSVERYKTNLTNLVIETEESIFIGKTKTVVLLGSEDISTTQSLGTHKIYYISNVFESEDVSGLLIDKTISLGLSNENSDANGLLVNKTFVLGISDENDIAIGSIPQQILLLNFVEENTQLQGLNKLKRSDIDIVEEVSQLESLNRVKNLSIQTINENSFIFSINPLKQISNLGFIFEFESLNQILRTKNNSVGFVNETDGSFSLFAGPNPFSGSILLTEKSYNVLLFVMENQIVLFERDYVVLISED